MITVFSRHSLFKLHAYCIKAIVKFRKGNVIVHEPSEVPLRSLMNFNAPNNVIEMKLLGSVSTDEARRTRAGILAHSSGH